jgi:hypothetical protein
MFGYELLGSQSHYCEDLAGLQGKCTRNGIGLGGASDDRSVTSCQILAGIWLEQA